MRCRQQGRRGAEVVLKYCTCMNNKMSDNETQSITQWEKTHVAERKGLRPGSRLEIRRILFPSSDGGG